MILRAHLEHIECICPDGSRKLLIERGREERVLVDGLYQLW